MLWNILINIVTIAVMAGALYYAWRLDRKLSALDRNRAEMEKFVDVFSASISRAERAVKAMQEEAKRSGAEIEHNISRGSSLRDELNFLIDAADKIATRLTNSTSAAQSDALTRKPSGLMPDKPIIMEKKPEEAKLVRPPMPPVIQVDEEEVQQKNFPAWLKPFRKKEPEAPAPLQDIKEKEIKDNVRSLAEKELQQALDKMR